MRGVEVQSDYLRCSFADAPFKLRKGASYPVVLLGLTFNNFALSDAVSLIRNFLRMEGTALVCLFPAADKGKAEKLYSGAAVSRFCFGPLSLYGFHRRDFMWDVKITRGCVKMGFRLRKDVTVRGRCFKAGIYFNTAESYSRSKTDNVRSLSRAFPSIEAFSDAKAGITLLALGRP